MHQGNSKTEAVTEEEQESKHTKTTNHQECQNTSLKTDITQELNQQYHQRCDDVKRDKSTSIDIGFESSGIAEATLQCNTLEKAKCEELEAIESQINSTNKEDQAVAEQEQERTHTKSINHPECQDTAFRTDTTPSLNEKHHEGHHDLMTDNSSSPDIALDTDGATTQGLSDNTAEEAKDEELEGIESQTKSINEKDENCPNNSSLSKTTTESSGMALDTYKDTTEGHEDRNRVASKASSSQKKQWWTSPQSGKVHPWGSERRREENHE